MKQQPDTRTVQPSTDVERINVLREKGNHGKGRTVAESDELLQLVCSVYTAGLIALCGAA